MNLRHLFRKEPRFSKLPKSARFNFPKAIAPVFGQPDATLIYHGADKFEMRFQPPVALAVYARLLPAGLLILIIAICGLVGFSTIASRVPTLFAIAAAPVIYVLHGFFLRCFVIPRLLAHCHARGLICNAGLLNFTVWSRLNNAPPQKTTVPLRDVADVAALRGKCLTLATRDGQTLPFTRPLRDPAAAEALRRFIKNLTTLDTSLSPRWQEAAEKAEHKQKPESTPLRFSKRARRDPDRLPTKRRFGGFHE